MAKEQDDNQAFLDTPIFVPTSLEPGLEPNKDTRSDSVIGWIVGIISVTMVVWFITYKEVEKLAGIPWFISMCIYLIVFVIVGCLLIAKFVYKTDEKIAVRSSEGSSVHNTTISEVCNISAGGLTLQEFERDIAGVVINYQGCPAFAYSVLNGSTDGIPEGQVRMHYGRMQRIIDTIVTYNFERYSFSLKYNTENDNTWDQMADKIYNVADELGEGYVDIMHSMLEHQFEYTKEHSSVSVCYHIVKMRYDTSLGEMADLFRTIKEAAELTISEIVLLDFNSFQRFLQDYYCRINLDLATLIPKTSYKESLGNSYVTKIYDKGWVEKKQPTPVQITKDYYDNVYTEVYQLPEDVAPVLEELDIFKD